jgi:hypothetical protein
MANEARVYYASVDGRAANESLPVGAVLQTVWSSPTGSGAVWVKTSPEFWTEKFSGSKAYPFPVWEKALVLTYVPEDDGG